MESLNTHWVADSASLDTACAMLMKNAMVAVDTEFMRETTFHAIPALIQLSDGRQVWLVDPVAVTASDAFRHLMGSDGPLKLIHACSEDLEVLVQWAQCLPEPFIDTQVAESLCGTDASMGYQRLVLKRLGIEVAKDATRSDWLARPLSDRQIRYAALDVLYLPSIWESQQQELNSTGRMAWVQEECHGIIDVARANHDFSLYYLRNRNTWKLSRRGVAAYAALCEWRETEARTRNLPRNWLASDGALFALADALPSHKGELAAVADLRPSVIKRDGAALLAIAAAAKNNALAIPAIIPLSPVSPEYRHRLKLLKQVVNALAKQLGIAPEVLVRRRDYDEWIRHAENGTLDQASLGGWRSTLLDHDLRRVLEREENRETEK